MSTEIQKKEIYQRMFSIMPTGFVLYRIVKNGDSTDFLVEDANMAFSSTISLQAAPVRGKLVSEILEGSNAAEWAKALEDAVSKQKGVNMDVYLGKPYGKWLAVHAFPVDEYYVAATYADITSKKRMENALSQERSMLNSVSF